MSYRMPEPTPDLLRRYLESDASKREKIVALKNALSYLNAEIREEEPTTSYQDSIQRSAGQLFGLIDQVEPAAATGALVPIRALRLSNAYVDKSIFDEAIIKMATDGWVNLHRHDWPASLTDDEKRGMVPDGRGGYFIGVAKRA